MRFLDLFSSQRNKTYWRPPHHTFLLNNYDFLPFHYSIIFYRIIHIIFFLSYYTKIDCHKELKIVSVSFIILSIETLCWKKKLLVWILHTETTPLHHCSTDRLCYHNNNNNNKKKGTRAREHIIMCVCVIRVKYLHVWGE